MDAGTLASRGRLDPAAGPRSPHLSESADAAVSNADPPNEPMPTIERPSPSIPILVALLGVVASACGGNEDGRASGQGAGDGITGPGSFDGTADAGDDPSDGGGGPLLDLGAVDTTGDGGEECASAVTPAENTRQPADILVVVDNSGSMDFEASAVQANLNAFSQQIIDSGIDVRVVLISSFPNNGNGICIDPPLGIGGCPNNDTNPPLYTHIDSRVNSSNALVKIIEHEPQWRTILRPDAALHLMVVTDDESQISALDFENQFEALSPAYISYKLHGIVCTTQCAETAQIGEVYIALGQLTGGIISDLCLQDFQPVFDQLATEVIAGAQIACEWEVPVPPPGEDFDPTKVNVDFDDGMGGGFDIGYVESAAACADVVDGWYYDDPVAPTLILACPQTCQKIQGVETAQIDISLGCDTIPAG